MTSGVSTPVSVIWFLILGFLAESVGYWVKERQELLLTVAVRQLTYRRFREIFGSSSVSRQAHEYVLTYPTQISQFAFIVDFAVSALQIVAFLVTSLVLYGTSGAVAVLLIAGLVLLSVRLVHLVGALWKQYVALEGERRRWIQRVADALPRGQAIPSWGNALGKIARIRNSEERLLHRRVPLQVLNGFLERGALTTTLAVVVILGAWLWPATSFGIGIILAARYLHAAVQNNIVNYRVIRLAVPMMRELDKLETTPNLAEEQQDLEEPPSIATEVLEATCDRAEALRMSVTNCDSAFVPCNPEIPQSVLSAWRTSSSPQQISQFTSLALDMGLNEDVIKRLWQDAKTLSSGEKHRAAIALVLVDKPHWLILDDTFAALDPLTREVVAERILECVPVCTLIASSEEYVPNVFTPDSNVRADRRELEGYVPSIAEGVDDGSTDTGEVQDLPDPQQKYATFRRSVGLLFGPHVVWIAIGALLLGSSEVAFALTLAQVDALSAQIAAVSAACALAAIVGSVMFFGSIYRVPIARLSCLHGRIMQRINYFASPRTSGAVVGRIGEDFSDLQMSVPSALGSVFLVSVQTVMLIGGAVAGAPLFLIVVLAVVPLALLAMRQGSKWILPASTTVANSRGEFIGAVGAQAGLHNVPVSTGLNRAVEEAYANSETTYISSSVQLANAYALRTGLIQLLVLSLNVSAVMLVLLFGESSSLVAPVAVIYFAVTLSSGVQSTVETLQEVGVVGLTMERVRMLEEFQMVRSHPPVRYADLERLENALDCGYSMVALIGPTGAGKSVILDALYYRHPEGEVAIVPDVDPFASELSDLSGIALAHSVLREDTARLILLDETLKKLTPAQERAEIESLARALEGTGKQIVIVLHSRSNLDYFRAVVNLNE
ncbi:MULTISPECIES: ABC transporter ATP-binding protein [unclassified Corynebacterium]|uniref:ATP-binding cassette domain-containing protein n=1 Tax=unclassified Corynebacterium TaxID=2624378 RepID=UPI001B315AEB|nr:MULTISPECIES: hypothetical protein [unclassified Corynebacterium]